MYPIRSFPLNADSYNHFLLLGQDNCLDHSRIFCNYSDLTLTENGQHFSKDHC